METFFAPAGRDSADDLQRRVRLVEKTPLLKSMLDALPTCVLILNENRQILAANKTLLRLLGVPFEEIVGRRTGEVVGCAFWAEGPDGCGTTRHCLTCGAVAAVLESQETHGQATEECRMTLDTALDGGAKDLRVTASALVVDEDRLTVCTIEDVSQQKRLAVLSRVFFHDVLNTAGGIQGFVRLLEQDAPREDGTAEELHQLAGLSDQLIGEIESHRDLTLAESGDLQIQPEPVRAGPLLRGLEALYACHPVAQDRHIELIDIWDGRLISDARLLTRVLGNMIKNALEATKPGGTVTVRCEFTGAEIVFSVHNDSVMPERVRLQIFQRSFTTKGGTGRGIGTYSMKLLGEHYLGGKVTFTSDEDQGTTFKITVPWAIPTLAK